MLIRQATVMDIPVCCELLDALRLQSVWGAFPVSPSPSHAIQTLLGILHNTRECVLVAEVDGDVVGICAGQLNDNRFLPGLTYLYEWAFYVLPHYRTMKIGYALWEAMKTWAVTMGCYAACFGRFKARKDGQTSELLTWQVLVKEQAHA